MVYEKGFSLDEYFILLQMEAFYTGKLYALQAIKDDDFTEFVYNKKKKEYDAIEYKNEKKQTINAIIKSGILDSIQTRLNIIDKMKDEYLANVNYFFGEKIEICSMVGLI